MNTAIIKNGVIYLDPSVDEEVLEGYIYNDSRGRFPDGTLVTTSFIKGSAEVNGKHFIITQNTVYEIM